MPVDYLLPAALGAVQDWDPIVPTGTPLWLAVQDYGGHDGDSSYATSLVTGSAFSVRCEGRRHPDSIGVVNFVTIQFWARSRVIGGNLSSVAMQIRSGGQVYEGPVLELPGTYMEVDGSVIDIAAAWKCEKDPATGQPWTPEAALAAEVGLVDRSVDPSHTARASTIRKALGFQFRRDIAVGLTRR